VTPTAYRTLLATPHVRRALLTSLAGRAAAPMAGLAVVLYVVGRTGSFAAAGLISAVWTAGAGVGGLVSSRLIDRARPRAVLVATAAGSAAGTVALAAVHTSSLPVLAAVAGSAALLWPPLVPATRALWPVLLPDEAARSTMYSLEATLQELGFIAGPVLAGAVAAAASPALAVALSGLVSLVGVAAFATTPGLAALAQRDAPRAGPRALVGLAPLFLGGALLVAALSMVEVGVVGVASGVGAAAAAGPLLAVWSVGSMAGGVVGGALPVRRGRERRLLVLLGGLAVATAALAPVHRPVLLGVLLVAGGALVAPALAAIYALVQQLAPPGAMTQTFAALTMFLLGGSAVGAAAAGALVEASGPGAAFLVAAAVPVAAAATVAITLARSMARERVRSRAPRRAPLPGAA
jgi:MFS family permease